MTQVRLSCCVDERTRRKRVAPDWKVDAARAKTLRAAFDETQSAEIIEFAPNSSCRPDVRSTSIVEMLHFATDVLSCVCSGAQLRPLLLMYQAKTLATDCFRADNAPSKQFARVALLMRRISSLQPSVC